MKADGGPAFACAAENGHQAGMSLRDYFAAQAMQALIATDSWEVESAGKAKRIQPRHIAMEAYLLADAMLAARSKA